MGDTAVAEATDRATVSGIGERAERTGLGINAVGERVGEGGKREDEALA